MEHYHYIDVLHYYRTGSILPADMVHHIWPLKEKPEIWLEDDNLIPLANMTHAVVENDYEDPARKAELQKELLDAKEFFDRRFYGTGGI